MKYCTKCNIEKPESEFNVRKASPDGLCYKCKECVKAYQKENMGKIISKYEDSRKDNLLIEKECTKCKKTKSIKEFSRHRRNKDGFTYHCKECVREHQGLNKERINTKRLEWIENNREQHLDKKREWRKNNPEKVKVQKNKTAGLYKESEKAYREANKERRSIASKEWRKENPDKVKASKRRAYQKDPLTCKMRSRIIECKLNGFKGAIRYLPYTMAQLAERLKKTLPEGYTWESFLNSETDLHVDHIRPVSSWSSEFRQSSESVPIIWALDNLQLLPALENITKSANWDQVTI